MKKKILALCLVVVLAITAVTGATLAYFTDTDEETNVFTTGNVKIELIEQQRDGKGGLEEFKDDKPLFPIVGSAQGEKDEYGMPIAENYVDKIVTIKNLASDAYVRLYYAIPAALTNDDASKSVIHVNVGNRVDFEGNGDYNTPGNNTTWNPLYTANVGTETKLAGTTDIDGVDYNVYYFDYNVVMGNGDTTAAFLAGVYMDENVDYDTDKEVYTLNGVAIEYDFTDGVNIPVYAVGVQSQGFDTCAAAVDAAFGADFNPFA